MVGVGVDHSCDLEGRVARSLNGWVLVLKAEAMAPFWGTAGIFVGCARWESAQMPGGRELRWVECERACEGLLTIPMKQIHKKEAVTVHA